MNLFIDESKPFAYSPKPNSWSVVGCYAISDDEYNKAQSLLKKMKSNAGFKKDQEVKINELSEEQYLDFISGLTKLGGTFYAVATDSNINTPDAVASHQAAQGEKIVEQKSHMKYEQGKQNLENLKQRLLRLSPQLYIQLLCQLNLIFKVVHAVIPYYIQRSPASLSGFRWRVDQKDVTRTDFENMFEILGPMIIQTRSMSDPLKMIKGIDYSVLKRYEYTKETVPKYLSEQYGKVVEEGYDIQGIIRDDIDFIDSKKSPGIQIVDLLVSGLRKCLRLEFTNNREISYKLGGLMVQAEGDQTPVDLVCYSPNKGDLNPEVETSIRLMIKSCRPFINHSHPVFAGPR